MNGSVILILICAIHFGLSISFSIQRWNELSESGPPSRDSTLREQFGDSLLAAFVVVAAVVVEPAGNRMAVAILLWLIVGVLMTRLFRRLRRSASLGRHSANSR